MKILRLYVLTLVSIVLWNCKDSSKTNEKSSETDGYVINGTVKGLEDGTIYLKQNDVLTRTTEVLDSTAVTNGKFVFKGTIDKPDQVFIQKDDKTIMFFLENTEMDINADATLPNENFQGLDASIEGSKLNDLFAEQQEKEKAIIAQAKYAELTKIQKEYHKAQQARNKEKSEELYKALEDLNEVSNERTAEILKSKLEFVNKYPSSAVSPNVLGFMFSERNFTVQEMDKLMETFSGEAKNTGMFRYFDDEYQAIKRTSPGAIAPDFTLKTPQGNDFSLSETKGKYVLLDFWASWCKPCRASYPHLKEVYKKYKDKGFEVVAISTDSDHEAWKKAIKEDQTIWIHVVDTFNRPGFPSDTGTLYAVPFLPTTYLLDPDGKILAKNLHADELDAKMKEAFGF